MLAIKKECNKIISKILLLSYILKKSKYLSHSLIINYTNCLCIYSTNLYKINN